MLSFSSKQRLVLLLGVVSWASASPVICGTQSDCSGQTGKDCCGISNYCVSPDYSQSVSCEVVACTRTLDCIGLNSRSTCCNTNQGSYCSTAAYCSNQNGGGGVGGANEPPTPPTTPAGEECTLAEEEIDAGSSLGLLSSLHSFSFRGEEVGGTMATIGWGFFSALWVSSRATASVLSVSWRRVERNTLSNS